MSMMPQAVMDRIDYHYEALKISNENSGYVEFMNKNRNYNPPSRLGGRVDDD